MKAFFQFLFSPQIAYFTLDRFSRGLVPPFHIFFWTFTHEDPSRLLCWYKNSNLIFYFPRCLCFHIAPCLPLSHTRKKNLSVASCFFLFSKAFTLIYAFDSFFLLFALFWPVCFSLSLYVCFYFIFLYTQCHWCANDWPGP
jgi:hypothetical protein